VFARAEFATREAAEDAIEQARAAFAQMEKPADTPEPEWRIIEADSMDAARIPVMPSLSPPPPDQPSGKRLGAACASPLPGPNHPGDRLP